MQPELKSAASLGREWRECVRRWGKERLGEFNSCQKDPRARHIMYPYVLANLAGRCVFVVRPAAMNISL
jgi:hypothetical protein